MLYRYLSTSVGLIPRNHLFLSVAKSRCRGGSTGGWGEELALGDWERFGRDEGGRMGGGEGCVGEIAEDEISICGNVGIGLGAEVCMKKT